MDRHGWVDESELHHHVTEPLYAMCAVIVSDLDSDETLSALGNLASSRSGKLHWRELTSDRDRAVALNAVLKLIKGHNAEIVISRRSLRGRKAASARHDCLKYLLWDMEVTADRPTSHAVLESRDLKADQKEIQFVNQLRRSGVVSTSFRCDYAKGAEEPRLWLPDIMLGAFAWIRQHRVSLSTALMEAIGEANGLIRLVGSHGNE